MWIPRRDLEKLSDCVRAAAEGKEIELRDNKEGALSILKNDINTLVQSKDAQMLAAKKERDELSDYLADISHQLKTPITSMMIMTELLEDAPDEKQAEFVGNMKHSLTRMEWLVSALLKMAKLDSKVVKFTFDTFSVTDLIREAVEPLDILLDVKNQSIEIRNDSKILCDKRWTQEAITNVIKNASEHSPVGGKIVIDSGSNPIYHWISITDSGEGLKKEQYAALFQRFEHSTSENGYGIGMPLALSIIRGQNGDIDIDFGGKGKGATFIIKFYK